METTELTPGSQATVKGLRDLADFLEKNPWIKAPYLGAVLVYVGAGEVSQAARSLGTFDKEFTDDFLNMNKSFGPVRLQVYTNRANVCRKVKTGTKIVTKKVIDPSYLAANNGLPMVEVKEEVPVYEFVCPPSLLDFDPASVTAPLEEVEA